METAAVDTVIREFQPGDEGAFRRLNEEWILRYFAMEPKDKATLLDPKAAILDPGGRILMAVQGGQTVGCCALVRIAADEFEVAKMAVTEWRQGSGIGRRLLEWTIREAAAAGARRLYLETNSKLMPAIRLYESVGFVAIPRDRVTPSPYARSDVAMELFLDGSSPPCG